MQLLFVRAITPPFIKNLYVQPQSLHHIYPQVRKLPVSVRYNLVSRRQGVSQCCLPTSSPSSGEDKRCPLCGSKNESRIFQYLNEEASKPRVTVVLPSNIHGPQDSVMNIHWTCIKKSPNK